VIQEQGLSSRTTTLFAECKILDNFRGLCGPKICKLVLKARIPDILAQISSAVYFTVLSPLSTGYSTEALVSALFTI